MSSREYLSSGRKPFSAVVSRNLGSTKAKRKYSMQPMQPQATDSGIHMPVEDDTRSAEQLRGELQLLGNVYEKFCFVCNNGTDQISLQLLSELANSHPEIKLSRVKDESSNSCSLLHLCAKMNKIACMEMLMKSKVSVDIVDNLLATPLHYAVAHNCEAATALLLANGASINARDSYNKWSLLLALKNRNYKIARMLSKCDVHLKGTKGASLLHMMAQENNSAAVRFLVEEMNASPFRRDANEEHVWFYSLPFPAVTDYMCTKFADRGSKILSHENSFGRTLLHECCINGHFDSLLMILKHVKLSDEQITQIVNKPDNHGDTPLILAVKNERYDLVEFLCECSQVEINEPDGNNHTAMYIAAGMKDKKSTTILTKYGASIKSNKEQRQSSRGLILNFLLSIRTLIMATSVTQILLSCLIIWIISFVLGRTSNEKTSLIVMKEIGDKVSYFIDGVLQPPRTNAQLLVDAFEGERLLADNTSRPQLFSHATKYDVATIALGDYGFNSYFGVEKGVENNTDIFYWRIKEQTAKDFLNYRLDPISGEIVRFDSYGTRNYQVNKRDWYIEGITANIDEPLWGTVYWSNSAQSLNTFIALPLVMRESNGTRTKIGIVKNNVSLYLISRYMQSIKLMGQGYVLILESNGDVVGSTVDLKANTTNAQRTNIFQAKTRGIALMARGLKKAFSGNFHVTENKVVKFRVNNKRYIASALPYTLDNLEWSVFVIFSDQDLFQSVYTFTYATIVVTICVVGLGIAIALVNGYIVTRPLVNTVNLIGELRKVSNMDLDRLQKLTSVFTEISLIYVALDEMTTWLKEFRAFLPDAVLQREYEEQVIEKDDKSSTGTGSGSFVGSNPSDSSQSLSSSILHKRNRFKLGLTGRSATVLVVGINDVQQFYSLPPMDIVNAYSKFFTQVNSIVTQTKGIVQVLPQTMGICAYWDTRGQEQKAISAALDIVNYTKQLSAQLEKENYPALRVSCGIHSSHVLAGNIGMSNSRLFSIVGSLLSRTELMQKYCSYMKMNLIVSEATWSNSNKLFVGRPVDILKLDEESMITIYEISCKINARTGDEWVHELDGKGKEEGYADFNNAFSLMNRSYLQEARDLFKRYSVANENDGPTANMLQVIETLEEREDLNAIRYSCTPMMSFVKRVEDVCISQHNFPLL